MSILPRTYLFPILLLMMALPATAVKAQEIPDSTQAQPADAQADSTEEVFEIIPWRHNHPLQADTVATDSTLRWQNWPNWTYKKNRDHDVITSRLGTLWRSSSMTLGAHEPRHQQLFLEDIPLNDPVSGTINWNVIPLLKANGLYEENDALTHSTHFDLKQYYVNRPLSRLSYDESKYDMRTLEFLVTQNFTQKTGVEISYKDRRDGGGYSNSSATGRQLHARFFKHFDNRRAVKLQFLNNAFTLGEPFGYAAEDPAFFAFDRYNALPLENNAESETGYTTLMLQYYQREEREEEETRAKDDFRAGIFLNSANRTMSYSADTTSYGIRTLGANAHKWLEKGPVTLEGQARNELSFNTDQSRSSVNRSSWNLLSGEARIRFEPLDFVRLNGKAGWRMRSDGFSDYQFGTDVEISAGPILLSGGGSSGVQMPTPQQLYWNSDEFSGNPDLRNEQITEAHAKAEIQPFSQLKTGVRFQGKMLDDAPLMVDSTFSNAPAYNLISPTAYATFDNRWVEASVSATAQQYIMDERVADQDTPQIDGDRVWLKGSAYWKGYVLSRAAYLKAGLNGVWSPDYSETDEYYPVLDFWQQPTDNTLIPPYTRLDLDISARVRSIMFVMRWENVFDGINQLGYFETVGQSPEGQTYGYPMPERRFIFGVRALFRN